MSLAPLIDKGSLGIATLLVSATMTDDEKVSALAAMDFWRLNEALAAAQVSGDSEAVATLRAAIQAQSDAAAEIARRPTCTPDPDALVQAMRDKSVRKAVHLLGAWPLDSEACEIRELVRSYESFDNWRSRAAGANWNTFDGKSWPDLCERVGELLDRLTTPVREVA